MQSLISDSKLAIILLAAGEGSRLGFYPKALLEKNGTPLIKRFWKEALDRKSTRLNSSHVSESRMPSSA